MKISLKVENEKIELSGQKHKKFNGRVAGLGYRF